MKKYGKRLLALLLACVMVLVWGVTAFARDAEFMIDNIKIPCDGTLTLKISKLDTYENEYQYGVALWYTGYGPLIEEIYFDNANDTVKTASCTVKKGKTCAIEGAVGVADQEPVVSVKYTFTPVATKLSSVKNTTTKAMTVRWKKVSGVTGYQIQYSTRSNFSSAKTVTINKASTVFTKIRNLNKGKKYYVRVRTYSIFEGRKCYSEWSANRTVRIQK